jgi:hypothetical protein
MSKAINLKLMSPAVRALYESLDKEGQEEFLGFPAVSEIAPEFDVPVFNAIPCENVYSHGNAFIVLGKDRLGSSLTSRSETHAAAIDIVAGRKGHLATHRDSKEKLVIVDADPVLDAARIYISQRCAVDKDFRIPRGVVGFTGDESPKSTVALKADTLRLIARENIKLVTKTDAYNSQGGELKNIGLQRFGIDLIACGDDRDMQPLVKGENLKQCLTEVVGAINELRGLFNNYVDESRQVMIAMANHTHISPFYGSPTSPPWTGATQASIKSLISIVTDVTAQLGLHATKCAMIETNYLGATEVIEWVTEERKSTYILSKYNNTN